MRDNNVKNTGEVQEQHLRKPKLESINSKIPKKQKEEIISLQEDNIWDSIVNATSDWIILTDIKGRILRTNLSGEKFTGLSSSEMTGQLCCKLIHGSTKRIPGCPIEEMILTGKRAYSEIHLPDKKQWLMVSVDPVTDKEGNINQIIHTVRDITEHKKAREEQEIIIEMLRLINSKNQKHELMKLVIKFLKDWSQCDAIGIRLQDGEDFPYYETSGFSEEFILAESYLCSKNEFGQIERDRNGKPYLECMCGNIISGRFVPSKSFFTEYGSFWTNSTTELLAGTNETDRMAKTRNRCNTAGYESVALIPLRTSKKTFGLLQFNDKKKGCFTPERISLFEKLADSLAIGLAEKQADEMLRESEKRFKDTFESTLIGLYRTTPDGRILMANPALVKMLGYESFEELAAKNLEKEGYEPEYPRSQFMERIEVDGQIIGLESAWIKKDGTTLFIRESARAICDSDGNTLYYQGSVEDITERKKAEQALGISEEKYRDIIENVMDIIYTLDMDGNITSVNKAVRDILGFGPDELIGRNFTELIPEDELPKAMENFKRIQSGEKITNETILIDKKGKLHSVEYSTTPIMEAGRVVGTRGIVRDITERKEAEEALRKSEQQFRMVLESSVDNLYRRNLKTDTYDYISPAVERLSGYSVEDMLSMPLESLVSMIHPDDIDRVNRVLEESMANDRASWLLEYRFRHKDGQYRWLSDLFTVIRDEQGRPLYLVGNVRDITDRKQAEEEHLNHLRFMESMDRINRAIQGTNDLEQMMSDVLDEVLFVFDCDRASLVYPCDPDAATWRAPMERTKPEWPGALALNLEVPMDPDVIMVYKAVLTSDDPVGFGPGNEELLPLDVAERFHERSQLAMAIYPKEGKPYMFVIHQCSRPRIWIQEERRLFKEIGRRLEDGLTSLLMYRDLKERESKYRELADSITDVFFAMDTDLRYTYWNKASEELTGIKAKDALGKTIFEVFPDTEDTRKAAAVYQDVLKKKQPRSFENEYRLKDKRYFFEVNAYPNKDGISVFTKDITERKRAEEALANREAELRSLLDGSDDAVYAVDGNYRYIFVNDEHLLRIFDSGRISQKRSEKVIGKLYQDLHPEEESKEFIENVGKVFETGESMQYECKWPKIEKWSNRILSPIKDLETGKIKSVLVISRDITDRKRAEQELEKGHNLLRLLIDNIPDRIFLKDKEHRFILGNKASAHYKGFKSEDELIGKTDFDLYPEKDAKAFFSSEQEIIKKGKSIINEKCYYKDKDGKEEWSLLTKVPLRDLNGDIIGLAGIKRDITEQKKAEDALRESEEKLGMILDTVPAMIWLKDVNGKYIWINKCHADSIGIQKEKVAGKNDFSIFPKEQAEQFQKDDKEVLKTQKPKLGLVEKYSKPDGTIGWIRTNKLPFFNKNNELVGTIGFALDITVRKQAEDALHESEELFRSFIEQAPEAVFVHDLNGQILLANELASKYTGYSNEELLNMNVSVLDASITEQDHKNKYWEKLLVGEDVLIETVNKGKNGIVFPVEVQIVKIIFKNKPMLLCFVRDITERKRVEGMLRENEQLLNEVGKIAKIGGWEMDLITRKAKWTKGIYDIVEIDYNDSIPGPDEHVEFYLPEYRPIVEQAMKRLIKDDIPVDFEAKLRTAKGNIKWCRAIGRSIRKNGVCIKVFGTFQDITERKEIEENVLKYQEQLKSLASQLTLTEEKERYRIATELHDHISQYLAVSRIKLEELRYSVDLTQNQQILKQVSGWLNKAINETRSLTFDLSSPILYELGFERAVAAWLEDEIQQKHDIKTEFISDGQSKLLDDDVRVFLFRDVRELLFNVIKHANAKKVQVSIDRVNDNIEVSVEDDGVGFEPAEVAATATSKARFGLFSIRERLEHFGGRLDISSTPGRGSRIKLIAPLKNS